MAATIDGTHQCGTDVADGHASDRATGDAADDGGAALDGSLSVEGDVLPHRASRACGRGRGHRRAVGLVGVCQHWLAGDTATGRAARATVNVVVDLATASADRFGQLMRLAGGGKTPTLTARTVDTLSEHAELLLQIVDGRRPLAELRAEDTIPIATRRAVLARDRGCRFPGCRTARVHVHRCRRQRLAALVGFSLRSNPPPPHIVHREDDGTDDPDNLLAACDHHHLHYIHRLDWKPTLDPVTAVVSWRRAGHRTITTVPHGPVSRPPPPPGEVLPNWLAPPIPPAPTDTDAPTGTDLPDRPPDPPPDEPPEQPPDALAA